MAAIEIEDLRPFEYFELFQSFFLGIIPENNLDYFDEVNNIVGESGNQRVKARINHNGEQSDVIVSILPKLDKVETRLIALKLC